jgi:hypothetical protein
VWGPHVGNEPCFPLLLWPVIEEPPVYLHWYKWTLLQKLCPSSKYDRSWPEVATNLSPSTPGTWQELAHHRFIWHGSCWAPVPLASTVEFSDPLVVAVEVTLPEIQAQFVSWKKWTTSPVELVVGKPGINLVVYCQFQLRSLPSVIGVGPTVTHKMEMICLHLQLMNSVTRIGSYLYMCRITFKASCVFFIEISHYYKNISAKGNFFYIRYTGGWKIVSDL